MCIAQLVGIVEHQDDLAELVRDQSERRLRDFDDVTRKRLISSERGSDRRMQQSLQILHDLGLLSLELLQVSRDASNVAEQEQQEGFCTEHRLERFYRVQTKACVVSPYDKEKGVLEDADGLRTVYFFCPGDAGEQAFEAYWSELASRFVPLFREENLKRPRSEVDEEEESEKGNPLTGPFSDLIKKRMWCPHTSEGIQQKLCETIDACAARLGYCKGDNITVSWIDTLVKELEDEKIHVSKELLAKRFR